MANWHIVEHQIVCGCLIACSCSEYNFVCSAHAEGRDSDEKLRAMQVLLMNIVYRLTDKRHADKMTDRKGQTSRET